MALLPLALLRRVAVRRKPELLVLELSSPMTSVYLGGDSPLCGVDAAPPPDLSGRECSAGGVEEGVAIVLGVTSTSSASRYHFRRRV